jgi:hypothetical protein
VSRRIASPASRPAGREDPVRAVGGPGGRARRVASPTGRPGWRRCLSPASIGVCGPPYGAVPPRHPSPHRVPCVVPSHPGRAVPAAPDLLGQQPDHPRPVRLAPPHLVPSSSSWPSAPRPAICHLVHRLFAGRSRAGSAPRRTGSRGLRSLVPLHGLQRHPGHLRGLVTRVGPSDVSLGQAHRRLENQLVAHPDEHRAFPAVS